MIALIMRWHANARVAQCRQDTDAEHLGGEIERIKYESLRPATAGFLTCDNSGFYAATK